MGGKVGSTVKLVQQTSTQRDTRLARQVLRYGALAAPVSMLLYSLLLGFSVITPAHTSLPPNAVTLTILSVAWVALGVLTFTATPSRTNTTSAIEITLYYTLAALQIWLVGGMATPFAAYIVLLLVATYAMLGNRGMTYGIASLMLITIVDTVVLEPGNVEWAIHGMLTMVAIATTALVIVLIYAQQQTSHLELERSRAREEAERERAQMLINNFIDAVFSIDRKGTVKTYNAAALNILDTNDNIDGKKIATLLTLETIDGEPLDVFKELAKDSSIRKRDDIIMRIGQDDLLRLEATFAPVQSSSGTSAKADSYVLIIRDITRMKSLEEERDEFISVVSHELRTPVTIAEGSLDNAELFAERGSTKQSRQAVVEAHKQVLFLAKMINDLSTLSRAERGASDTPEDIDTRELAHALHGDYASQAEAKGLVLNLDIVGHPGTVKASRLYLHELLQNFITNAIKYTQEGSVTLHVKSTKDTVTFSISDTGIGIRKADLENIFKRFYRAEDFRTRETSGTGLGLYVSAKLAKKIGCKINVESRINHGSTFSFSLPRER